MRASVLADPDGARKKYRVTNTPAMITYKIVPGDKVDVHVRGEKVGGSEAKTKFAMLNPSDSVVDWVLKMVPTMGAGLVSARYFGYRDRWYC